VGVGRLPQLRADLRPATEDGVQVQATVTGVGGVARFGRRAERGLGVERDVVVQELADERRTGGLLRKRVVPVVRAESGLGDEPDGARAQLVLGVQETVDLADVDHCVANQARSRVGERRQVEHPAEPWVRGGGNGWAFDGFGESLHVPEHDRASGASGDARADAAQEPAPADAARLVFGGVLFVSHLQLPPDGAPLAASQQAERRL
jgi:hypothetical protein